MYLKVLIIFLLFSPDFLAAGVDWAQRGMTPEEGLPYEVEGVYRALGPEIENIGVEKRVEFKITLVKSDRTGHLNFTVANGRTGNILFFASQVPVTRERENRVVIESSGTSMTGARQYLRMEIDLVNKTLTGEIDANYLATVGPIFIEGTKENSILEALENNRVQKCGEIENYLGLFLGRVFETGTTEVVIKSLKDRDGRQVLTANLDPNYLKSLYPDGNFNENLGILSFEYDLTYPFNGKFRKLILFCDQDELYWILRGLHIASNGRMIRDIELRKKKNQ